MFPIGDDCEEVEEDDENAEGGEVVPQFYKGGPLQVDCTHDVDVVAGRKDGGELLCPLGHGADGGEQSAQQYEDDDEEEHHEHGLLDVVGEVGHGHTEA